LQDWGVGVLFRQADVVQQLSLSALTPAAPASAFPLGPHAHAASGRTGSFFVDTGRVLDVSGSFSLELWVFPAAEKPCTLVSNQNFELALEPGEAGGLVAAVTLNGQVLTSQVGLGPVGGCTQSR
jgi:hypothetical protein